MIAMLHPSESYQGLTSEEAARRRKTHGDNAQPQKKPKGFFSRVWGIISEPMMLLLVATAIIYLSIGDRLQGAVIFLSIIPITIMEFLQEKRTDTALAALGKLRVDECQIYRDGKVRKLPSSELVPGDLVYLTAGDKVPADGAVVFTPGILIDESILTGESAPVEKVEMVGDISSVILSEPQRPKDPSAHERDSSSQVLGMKNDGVVPSELNTKVFQGTMVTQGEARIVVMAIGQATEYGKLGKLLETIEIKSTPLQERIEALVKKLAIAAIAIAILIGVVLSFHYTILHGLLAALTVAIAIIPEEFPIVFSVFLIMGVMRMTRRRAVVRQMALVETLGSATVICTDKTGTLTQGTLRLTSFYHKGTVCRIEGDHSIKACEPLIFDALLAVEQVATDPIEIEVQRLARQVGILPEKIFTSYLLRHDSSFDAVTKLVQHVWESPTGELVQYVAGAPESVIARANLGERQRAEAEQMYQTFARDGYRVIAVGKKELHHDESKPHNHNFEDGALEFSGLLAMIDPPRDGVKEAVSEAYRAGIKLIMITGDNALTATHLAKEIGLTVNKPPMHGDEVEKMSPDMLGAVVHDTTIFTRVRPEQKYRIVEALQKNGEVVAMTGDGVNDAPALKKADIGIAMGLRGTEVARAAAGMILLDDNFSTIMGAVEEGRRIYDNLRRAFVFLFSLHIPIVGMAVVPLFFGQDLFFVPLQIIFLELFGDPASVIGFERDALRSGAMKSPPRPKNEPLINPKLWGVVALYGLSIFALTLGTHLLLGATHSFEYARTLAFVVLVFAQITLILFSRDWVLVKSNKVLLSIATLTLTTLTIFTFIPSVNHVFSFVPIDWNDYALAALGATAIMFVVSRIGRRIARV